MEDLKLNNGSFEEMTRDYERLLTFMDNIPDSIWFKDVNNRFVKVNKTKAEHYNTTPDQMIGKSDFDYLTDSAAASSNADDEKIIKTGESLKSKVEKIIRKNGEETWVSVTKIPWFDRRGDVIGTIGVARDITDIKNEEETRIFEMRQRDILYGLLEISLSDITLDEQLDRAIKKILSIPWLPLSPKGGIFLVEDDSEILILKAQRNLHPTLQNTCSHVPFGRCLCGRAAIEKKVVFADHVDDRHDNAFDGMLAHGHYCVPILSEGRLLGVLVLYVQESHLRSEEEERYLIAIANALASIIDRKKSDEKIKKSHQIQDVLNAILKISMRPISLKEQLERILNLILDIPWLALQSKGSISLVEDQPGVLVMKAHRGLADALLDDCENVPFGKCLCGLAALKKEMVFADRIDERHHITFDGMLPHGHYCVPILSGSDILGVLNMYIKEGYKRSIREEDFLLSVANTLAGIIKRKQVEESLKYMATYDSLTGLHNRMMFFDHLSQALNQARRYGHKLAVMFLDLDGFKPVNDTLGHNAGDQLLKQSAERLKGSVRESDTVSRMGGDEFTVLLSRVDDEGAVEPIVRKLLDVINIPFIIEDKECSIGVSIGVSLYPADGDDMGTLVKNADMAMYRVKEQGKNGYLFFSQLTVGALAD
ncbi:MAG: diguanylate cyclase [Nitrospirae bacterium]|nr:diguanylate cyclase [Nitrospirota bacterium]